MRKISFSTVLFLVAVIIGYLLLSLDLYAAVPEYYVEHTVDQTSDEVILYWDLNDNGTYAAGLMGVVANGEEYKYRCVRVCNNVEGETDDVFVDRVHLVTTTITAVSDGSRRSSIRLRSTECISWKMSTANRMSRFGLIAESGATVTVRVHATMACSE